MEVRVPKNILLLSSAVADTRTRAAIVHSAERELELLRSGSGLAARIRLRLFEQQGDYPSAQTMARQISEGAAKYLI
jgi:hypothetical protein